VHDHQIGNAIVIEIAARIRNVLGQRATVAHLGGDEFTALLPAQTENQHLRHGHRRLLTQSLPRFALAE
jgi:GGDEF domain-containing protein